jgi:hypothetical protein
VHGSAMVSAGTGLRSSRADVDCDEDDDAGEYGGHYQRRTEGAPRYTTSAHRADDAGECGGHAALSPPNSSDVEVHQTDVGSMRVEGDSFGGSGNVSPAGATTPDHGPVGATAAAGGLNDAQSKLGGDGGT